MSKSVLVDDKVFISFYQAVFLIYKIIITAWPFPDSERNVKWSDRDGEYKADRGNDQSIKEPTDIKCRDQILLNTNWKGL